MGVLITSYIILFVVGAILLLGIAQHSARTFERRIGEFIPFLIVIPSGLINPLREHTKSEIELSAELYKRLHEHKIPFVGEVAVHNMGEEIHFYLGVRRLHEKTLTNLVESLWPTGYVTRADEYDLLLDLPTKKDIVLAGGYVKQIKPYALPLKPATKKTHEPFLPILQQLSRLSAVGEGAAIQWIVKPAKKAIARDIGDTIENLESGTYHESPHVHGDFVITPESLKVIKQKVSEPLFAVNARIIAGAHTKGGAETILKRLSKTVSEATSSKRYNELEVISQKKYHDVLKDFFENKFNETHTLILNAEELATVFHLPGPYTPIPKLKRK